MPTFTHVADSPRVARLDEKFAAIGVNIEKGITMPKCQGGCKTTLSVACDGREHPKRKSKNGVFVAPNLRLAMLAARAKGWKLGKEDLCPTCNLARQTKKRGRSCES